MNKLDLAKRALEDALKVARTAAEALENADEETVESLEAEFTEAEADVARCRAEVEKQERIAAAKAAVVPAGSITVGKEEHTYRPDNGTSFFRDLVNSKNDAKAAERLQRNTQEVMAERRTDGDSTTTYGGYFIPPIYRGDLWAELPRAGRPFADKLPKLPLPDVGNTITVPTVSTGTAVSVQNGDNGSVTQTTLQASQVSADLVTIAGKNDYSRQAIERTFPGLDQIIFSDLVRAYNQQLDSQLIVGTGSSGQHKGLDHVSSVNTVTYTASSPTQAGCVSQILNAIESVYTTRFMQPNLIVMHPRRAAWLAVPNSSTFPLFQNGNMFHAVGDQEDGFAGTLSGIPILTDPNIPTTLGGSTNEDEIYVLYTPDMYLFEGDVQQVAYEEVLSANLEIRLMVFGYSFAMLNRQPTAICRISGTGLAAPGFTIDS